MTLQQGNISHIGQIRTSCSVSVLMTENHDGKTVRKYLRDKQGGLGWKQQLGELTQCIDHANNRDVWSCFHQLSWTRSSCTIASYHTRQLWHMGEWSQSCIALWSKNRHTGIELIQQIQLHVQNVSLTVKLMILCRQYSGHDQMALVSVWAEYVFLPLFARYVARSHIKELSGGRNVSWFGSSVGERAK